MGLFNSNVVEKIVENIVYLPGKASLVEVYEAYIQTYTTCMSSLGYVDHTIGYALSCEEAFALEYNKADYEDAEPPEGTYHLNPYRSKVSGSLQVRKVEVLIIDGKYFTFGRLSKIDLGKKKVEKRAKPIKGKTKVEK